VQLHVGNGTFLLCDWLVQRRLASKLWRVARLSTVPLHFAYNVFRRFRMRRRLPRVRPNQLPYVMWSAIPTSLVVDLSPGIGLISMALLMLRIDMQPSCLGITTCVQLLTLAPLLPT